jgi:hypothetical protein
MIVGNGRAGWLSQSGAGLGLVDGRKRCETDGPVDDEDDRERIRLEKVSESGYRYQRVPVGL